MRRLLIALLTALCPCHTAGDYILETKPKEISEAQRLNYEQVTLAYSLQIIIIAKQTLF